MGIETADVVICGAGIAGIAAAYHLTVTYGLRNVALVDERDPLSLTSDKSTECYRNWWPGPGDAMVRLMNRSIDLLDDWARESDNRFRLTRRGYVFLTADPQRIPLFEVSAQESSQLGAGPVRRHTGQPDDPPYVPASPWEFEGQPDGCNLILDQALIRKHFPYVNEKVVAVLHARRCGWLSAQQLGMFLLEQARACGARLVRGRVEQVEVAAGRVQAVRLSAGSQPDRLVTGAFVIAAGPYLKQVGRLLGLDLPVYCELHSKIAFNDILGVVPRDAPMLIWTDPQVLAWSEEERVLLLEQAETRALLGRFPAGVHMRPEGRADSPILLMLWTYDLNPREPVWPPALDPYYPEVVLRGMTEMIPGLAVYIGRALKPAYDGGYYCKTRENRPLIGPLPVKGAYVIGALSGFGIMAAPAAGELLAAHVMGSPLPGYASAFLLERYTDPAYQALLENWGATGQL
ncbi:MAG: FAD-dependent oxidoreductase [Chloroflexota bacterium]